MPWLADIARIERAWLDAYHAADGPQMAPAALASVPLEQLADLVFVPHPATRIVCSNFAAVPIFAANRSEEPIGSINAGVPEDALITLPALARVRSPLPAGGGLFLARLIS